MQVGAFLSFSFYEEGSETGRNKKNLAYAPKEQLAPYKETFILGNTVAAHLPEYAGVLRSKRETGPCFVGVMPSGD